MTARSSGSRAAPRTRARTGACAGRRSATSGHFGAATLHLREMGRLGLPAEVEVG